MEQTILLEGLRQVREIVNNGWTQRVYARDEKGVTCSINHPNAKSFCLTGAILKVAKELSPLYKDIVENIMSCALRNYYANIPTFNDSSTKEEVLQAIDYTIKEIREGRDFLN
jgi:DNA phosphorothioation-dependent restriction protein DptG